MARIKQQPIESLLKGKVTSLENEIAAKQAELDQAKGILNNYIQNKETIESILSLQAVDASSEKPVRRKRRTRAEIEAEQSK